jgi:hypothetical protein
MGVTFTEALARQKRKMQLRDRPSPRPDKHPVTTRKAAAAVATGAGGGGGGMATPSPAPKTPTPTLENPPLLPVSPGVGEPTGIQGPPSESLTAAAKGEIAQNMGKAVTAPLLGPFGVIQAGRAIHGMHDAASQGASPDPTGQGGAVLGISAGHADPATGTGLVGGDGGGGK